MVMMHAEEVDEGNIPSPASVFLRYASCVSAKTFIQPLPHKAVEVKVRERHWLTTREGASAKRLSGSEKFDRHETKYGLGAIY